MTDGAVNRRCFLLSVAAASGSLALGFDIPFCARAGTGAAPEITAWVVIAPDDQVTIRVAKSEMGQGVLTALAMLVAEELACDWSNVRSRARGPARQPCARPRLWRHVDRRQPLDPQFGSDAAQGRRHRARDADRGGGGALGCCEC